MSLGCLVESPPPVAMLRLTGRLDRASSGQARAAVHKLLAEGPDGIVVDVSELTIDEDLTLSLFRTFADTAADTAGCPVVLCAPEPPLRKVLERMTVLRTLPVYPTCDQSVAAIEETPTTSRYRRRLPAAPTAPALAREVVVDACRTWGLTSLTEMAEILVTELVANAVQHAGTDARLTVRRGKRYLHLSVRDGSTAPPFRLSPGLSAASGRGLVLVEALAASWGSVPVKDGKVVWATLAIAN